VSIAYEIAIVLHVVVAVLGSGQIGAVAVVLASGRRAQAPAATTAAAVASLLAYVRVSLGLLVLTGIGMDIAARGALDKLWWVRLSFVLVIAEFFLLRRAQSTLARAHRGAGDASAMRGVEWIAWSMCGILGLIIILMRLKPF
jgi:hypothetical protein